MGELFVINNQKEKEKFSEEKVFRGCKNINCSDDLCKKIVEKVKKEVYPGITTREIFYKIRNILKREFFPLSIKFSLKEAMRKLGPSGFPFEKYVGSIFSSYGFKIKINQKIWGKCLKNYEIDFVAENNEKIYIGECKYRIKPTDVVDQTIALANYSRFLDINEGGFFKRFRVKKETVIVTNGRFSQEAMQYSRCKRMKILGWKYPQDRGLDYWIEKKKLYPVTILPSFRREYGKNFFEENKILVFDLLGVSIERLSSELKLPLGYAEKLAKEATLLLK